MQIFEVWCALLTLFKHGYAVGYIIIQNAASLGFLGLRCFASNTHICAAQGQCQAARHSPQGIAASSDEFSLTPEMQVL